MTGPTVGVVIPCYNHGRFVRDAVASALAQEQAQVRVVVVDDGSDDGQTPGACQACAGPRVRVMHQPNRGLPAARNAGVAALAEEGPVEYLVFLDADDRLAPAFVRTLAAAIRQADDPAVSHAYCRERLTGQADGVWRVPDWDPLLLLITNLHPVTALVRRECFEAVGGFDESLRDGYEDWDLWLRFAERGWRGVRVPVALFAWRRHSEQTLIVRAVRRHDELYARLIANHRDLYRRHLPELLVRSAVMLRRFGVGQVDEQGRGVGAETLRRLTGYRHMLSVRAWHALSRLREALGWSRGGAFPRPHRHA